MADDYLKGRKNEILNIPITEAEVVASINSMKNKTSCGYDGLLNKIIKLCGEQIAKLLNYVCNLSVSSGIYPNHLKYANIIPCCKKGDVTEIANYRLISLLTGFPTLFEILMLSRLKQHLIRNDILAPEQGFHKNVSMQTAVFNLTNTVLKAWNEKEFIVGIFCDLTKAVDCVSHELLIQKLEIYGVKRPILKWLNSYLSNRMKTRLLKNLNGKLLNLVFPRDLSWDRCCLMFTLMIFLIFLRIQHVSSCIRMITI
jgi:hypothetical protein